ncbi:MAG: cytochrome c3 family protein [Planctomycetota bacterium]
MLNAVGAAVYVPTVVFSALNPSTLNVGYRPEQPVPYSHALHVGQLGMDCRYCHTTVDEAGFAAIPSTQTCMNCHTAVKYDSNKLTAVRQSWETGDPIEWTKVHDLADYAYFNHSAHVNKGIGCYSCHGRVDQMGEAGVHQVEPLNMGWCLDCHRQPEKFIRPRPEVTNMDYHLGLGRLPGETEEEARERLGQAPGGPGDLVVYPGETPEEAQLRVGKLLVEQYNIKDQAYMTACSTCHR